jgi:hypothetical protein
MLGTLPSINKSIQFKDEKKSNKISENNKLSISQTSFYNENDNIKSMNEDLYRIKKKSTIYDKLEV